MAKYSIGIDFGTLSGRALLVDVETGAELAVAVKEYPHGVMEEKLPNGERLPIDYALQHPQDFLDVLRETIPAVLKQANVSPEDVIGIGIDFTSCTVLPIYRDGTPLCFKEEFKGNRHAYVKLWKHHAAQDQANRLNRIAEERGETFLKRYGGKISSEWMVPKIMEIVEEAPEIYREMDRFIEAADWIVMMLTGKETRNSCTAGYKLMWSKREGFPSKDFFKALHPLLENFIEEKIGQEIIPLGTKAGEITPEAAKLTGLKPGTAVAVGNVDAHVTFPALGITEPGKMLMIIGTSTCDILLGKEERIVPGMCGVVEDGVVPGFFGYEAGQSCVGDHFAWFERTCVPKEYHEEAERRGVTVQDYLSEKAAQLRPGESGLLALDWWNGNRSVLVDVDLTGLLLGQTLATKPEEIYRALIEATAFGARMIMETFAENGVPVDELYAAGGIVEKNPLMMQIYADVMNREIKLAGSNQAPALGSAIFGAIAAGRRNGGYDDVFSAAKTMGKLKSESYKPIQENVRTYELLFAEYRKLHDYFGRFEHVMKRLKTIKENVKGV